VLSRDAFYQRNELRVNALYTVDNIVIMHSPYYGNWDLRWKALIAI